MKLLDILRLAHKMEFRGMRFYKDHAAAVKLPVLKEIFGNLVEMEEGHATWIEKQIKNLENNLPLESPPEDMDGDLFEMRQEEQELEDGDLDSDLGDYSILRMAYLVEKDFAEFYHRSADQTEGEAKRLFEELAAWEEGHAELLKTQLEAIIARNALDLGFYPL